MLKLHYNSFLQLFLALFLIIPRNNFIWINHVFKVESIKAGYEKDNSISMSANRITKSKLSVKMLSALV